MLQGFRKGSLKFCKGCEGFCTGSRQVSERRGLCSQLQKAKGRCFGFGFELQGFGLWAQNQDCKELDNMSHSRALVGHLLVPSFIFCNAELPSSFKENLPSLGLKVLLHTREIPGLSCPVHMGGCQNYGPLVQHCTYYLGYPKRDHNLDNHPYPSCNRAVPRP